MGILSMLVKIGVDSSNFESGIKRVQNVGEKFGTNFKSAVATKIGAALSVTAIAAYTKSIMNFAGEIKDLGEQMNLTTDQVQRLQILANDTGISFDRLSAVLLKFEEARLKATSGDEDAAKSLKALGISNEMLYSKELLTIDGAIKTAKAHREAGRSAETTAAMYDIYGTKLTAAATALADYNKTEKRAIIDAKDINNLDDYNKKLEEQVRLLKTISALPIYIGLKHMFDPYLKAFAAGSSWMDKAEKAVKKAEIRGVTDEYLSRRLQQQIAEGRGNVTPPPIGEGEKQRFELEKLPQFNLGRAADDLARIGGFTGFGASQNTVIRNALDQTLQLKLIVKHTEKTANNTRD